MTPADKGGGEGEQADVTELGFSKLTRSLRNRLNQECVRSDDPASSAMTLGGQIGSFFAPMFYMGQIATSDDGMMGGLLREGIVKVAERLLKLRATGSHRSGHPIAR